MLEATVTSGNNIPGVYEVEQRPVLRIPFESSIDAYVKIGYRDYVGASPAIGSISNRESRGGLDLSQDINIKFSDRVFSGQEWTMMWWMYPENAVQWHNIGSTEAATTEQNTMLIQYDVSTFQGYFFINYPTGVPNNKWYRSKLTLTQNAWNHFTVTWKNGVLTSYKNGVKVATVNTSIFTGFGKYKWALAQNKNRRGTLADLMFFNEELTQEEVKEFMAMYAEV